MIENYGATTCEMPSPGPAPMAAMLAEADNLTEKAMAMVMQINNQVLGMGPKEMKKPDTRCMRDYVARHVDDLKMLCEELNAQPAVDAVPVVRCRECIYWQDNNGGYPHPECRWGNGETPDADDFCSYGERRDDNADR